MDELQGELGYGIVDWNSLNTSSDAAKYPDWYPFSDGGTKWDDSGSSVMALLNNQLILLCQITGYGDGEFLTYEYNWLSNIINADGYSLTTFDISDYPTFSS
jgi:hypothetical protein